MTNLTGFVKRLRDIMRNDAGINGDAQRIEQIAWLLFLKVYDTKEQDWEFEDSDYCSVIPEPCRWRNWAHEENGKGMTGDALLSFVNNTLFPVLKGNDVKDPDTGTLIPGVQVDPDTPIKKAIVKTTFEDANTYMKDGVLLRQVINHIDSLDLSDYEESHAFGEIYETILRELQSAGSSGEFYTPRAVTDFMAHMIQPKVGEQCADFACGTGGFLISWLKELEAKKKNAGDVEKIYNSVYGIEKKQFPYIAQEKAVLQYLTRDPQKYPVLIMALDPKQSVDEVYSQFGVTDVFNGMNPEIEKGLGNPDDICLAEAYRYTKNILKFLKHIDSSYPTYDFGEDWNNKIKSVSSKQEDGILPKFYYCESKREEVEQAVKLAKNLSGSTRVAILALQDDLFKILLEESEKNIDFKIIDSSSVTHTLKYVKRNVFISKPNYVIGLQFEVIILIGCYSIYNETSPNQSCYKRRFLNDLYLGASRAKKDLYLFSDKEAVSIPDVIKTAIDSQIIQRRELIK